MGVIIKQSIKNTAYAYMGAGIGFVNTTIFIKEYLTSEQYGITQYIFSIVLLSSSLLGLGFGSATGRLFPYFRDREKAHNGYLSLGIVVTLIGVALALLGYYLFGRSYFLESNDPLKSQYGFLALPVVILTLFYNFFDTFFRMNFNSSIGVFLREVVSKLTTSVTILLYAFKYIDFGQFMWLFFAAYCLPVPILLIKLIIDGDFVLTRPRPFLIKKLKYAFISIALFGLITGLSTVATLQIDRLMIQKMINMSSVGVYSMGAYFATLIIFPIRSVKRISVAVLSEAWKNKDLKTIDSIYKKSSITLLILGLYIFIGIWVNIENVMKILGEEYWGARYIIFFAGITNLITMISGVNLEIISTSRKYIYISVFMIITLVLIVITNLIFIPIWGIKGAAIASLISTFIFALLRYVFVLKKFKLQPLNYRHLIVLLIGLVSYGLVYMFPYVQNPFVDAVIKGMGISVIFFLLIYLSKTSEDLNQKINEISNFIVKIIRPNNKVTPNN